LGGVRSKLEARGCALVVLLPEPVARAQRLARLFRAQFPVLADPQRTVFRSFGLGRRWIFVQQSGTALVERDGTLSYIRRSTSPRGALDLAELMRAVEGRTGQEEM